MCGRYTLFSNETDIAAAFGISTPFNLNPSYNIAPTQLVSVVCEMPDQQRVILPMRWGLIPAWQKPENISSTMINARAETICTKPAFRSAIKHRRCLIVTNGFYEWKQETVKQPYFITMQNHQPFGMAGIWEKWIHEETVIDSCCIITVSANKLVSSVHDRMPAIIEPAHYKNWLAVDNEKWESLDAMLKPYQGHELEMYAVSRKVNNARFNSEECIARLS